MPPLGTLQAANQLVTVPFPPLFPLTMLPATNKNYVAWDAGSPLVALVAPAVWGTIPVSALKALPKFTGDNTKTLAEHLQDVADVCLVHGITTQNVALRLLAASFKGKALECYRTLTPNTIRTWDDLGDPFYERFSNDGDRSLLYYQLSVIKQAPQEALTDFNARFHSSWWRIPVTIRPTPELAFMFYLKSINLDISMMIKSLGGATLPDAYATAIKAENHLINCGKLPPQPVMPIFPEISNVAQEVASTSAPATPQSAYSYIAAPENLASTSGSPKNEMGDLKEMLRTMANDITTLKRNQAMPPRPAYQNYQGGRPTYQQNQYQNAHRTNSPAAAMNQIVLVPTPLAGASPSSSRELTAGQNNLIDDINPWCFPCNDAHMPRNCPRGNLQG